MKGVFLFSISCSLLLFFAACNDQGNPVTQPSDAPTIVSLSPDSGSVGDTITIKGIKFGSTQSSSTISFGSIAAASIGIWTDTLIKTIVPANAITSNVFVTVNGNKSNGKSFKVHGTLPATVSFAADIKPLFSSYGCNNSSCHGAALSGGLSVASVASLLIGGDHGPVIIANNASGSNLVKKLRSSTVPFGSKMPANGGNVSDTDYQLIIDWINQGAQ